MLSLSFKLIFMKMCSAKWLCLVFAIFVTEIVFNVNGLSSTSDREGKKLFGGYRITPKFCNASKSLSTKDPRARGPTICMFNHECSQRQGEVVGACMDGFLFGTCCHLPGTVPSEASHMQMESKDRPTSNSAAALSYEKFGSQLSNLNYNNGVFYNQVKLEENPTKDYNNVNNDNDRYSASIKPLLNKDQHYYGSNNDNYDLDNDVNANSNSYSSSNKIGSNQYNVPSDAVSVYSPSSGHYDVNKGSTYYPSSSTTEYMKTDPYLPPSPSQSYSQEIPTLLNSYESSYGDAGTAPAATEASMDFTSNGSNYLANSILDVNDKFDHSDISHPGAESILFNENGTEVHDYAEPSSFTPPASSGNQESKTEKPIRVTYPKPQFKPKPTQANDPNKYVLVHTIQSDNKYNETQTKPTVASNNIQSIESIILMLNDTDHGPHYSTDDTTVKTTVTYPYPTTSSINYDKYGPTSFYVTNKLTPTKTPFSTTQNQVPNNYVYSNSPTKIPPQEQHSTASTSHSPSTASYSGSAQDSSTKYPSTTLQPPQKVANTKRPQSSTSKPYTKAPSKTTVVNKTPSTSYVYSANPTKRPTSPPTTATTIITADGSKPVKKTTSKKPAAPAQDSGYGSTTSTKLPEYIIQSKPIDQQQQQQPQQPQHNYIQIATASDNPSPTVLITPKPTANVVTSSTWNHVSNPAYSVSHVVTQRPQINLVSTPGYGASLNDFEGEGYFGVTHRPAAVEHTVSSTAYYTIVDNNYGSSPSYGAPSFSYGVSPPSYNSQPSYGISSFLPQGPSPVTPTFDASNTVKIEVYEATTNKNDIHTSPDDFNNFPPVRNPNLNMTAGGGGLHGGAANDDQFDAATPSFMDDDILKNKMDLLVSKIVASLQGNFESLADTITETKNGTVLKDPVSNSTAKPSPIKRPAATNTSKPTRKPVKAGQSTTAAAPASGPQTNVTRKPTARPATGATKPSGTNVRPTGTKPAKPANQINASPDTKPTIVKNNSTRPGVATTTKRPIRRPNVTTKKPAGDVPVPTKKPAQKVSTKKPTTPKPPKRVTTVSTTTTEQDEIIEDDEEVISEEEDVGEEPFDGSEESSTESGNGEIRCGVRPQLKSGRIVGGKASKFGEFPWQVLVRESTWLGLFTKNKCGGVLISNSYVVTAAHCQPGFLASLVAVFGEYDISGELESKRSVTKNVKRIIVHRQYDAATFENDLALLELESPVHYDSHIVPICMPPDEADFTGRMATVTGWGRLKYAGGVPSVLQEVQVPVIENSVCQEMFQTAGHSKKILPSFLCAGYANGQKDSCEGDSGGPLVLQRGDGRYELAGTVSHGIKCAAPYLPGVYMRTTFYKPWLRSVMGK